MNFCPNCGTSLENEANFCIECGKPLGDETRQNTLLVSHLTEAKNILEGMIIHPISTMRSVASAPLQKPIYYLAFGLSILYALSMIWQMQSPIGTETGFTSTDFENIHYAFLYGVFFALSMMVAESIATLLVCRYLFKSQGSYLKALNITVASIIPCICCFLILPVLSYLNIWLAIIPLIFILITVICKFIGIQEGFISDADRAAFAIPLIYVLTGLIIYAVIYIIIKLQLT